MAAWTEKLEAAKGQCWVDVGFWGGVVPGEDTGGVRVRVRVFLHLCARMCARVL